MSDNILSQSTDLGVGNLTVGHPIEIRNVGKPLLTIHYDGQITVAEHLKPNEIASEVLDIMKSMNMADPQATKIRELQSDVNELKELVEYLQDRIRKLKKAGDDLDSWLGRETPVSVRVNWRKVKEGKP
jgi:ArsR family metal-binding transcriptional regulator